MERRSFTKWFCLALLIGVLATAFACILSPVPWSPDGKWVAFVHYREDPTDKDKGSTQLWIASPSPVQKKMLWETTGTVLSAPAWDAKGQNLFVVEYETDDDEAATRSRAVNLLRVGIDGKRTRVLQTTTSIEPGPAFIIPPAIEPGGRIAFARDEDTIVVANRSKIEREIEGEDTMGVSWSPGGEWLCITREAGGEEASIQLIRGSRTIELPAGYRALAWQADTGRIVAFQSATENGTEKHYVVTVDPTADLEPRRYPVPFKPEGPVVLSPDGQTVYFARDGEAGDPKVIYRFAMKDLKIEPIYRTTNSVRPSAVSPDGNRLSFREAIPEDSGGGDSIVGILDVQPEVGGPIFLPVDEDQMEEMIEQSIVYLNKLLKEAPAGKEEIDLRKERLNQYFESFRRMFPESKYNARLEKGIRDAGIGK